MQKGSVFQTENNEYGVVIGIGEKAIVFVNGEEPVLGKIPKNHEVIPITETPASIKTAIKTAFILMYL